MSLDPCPNYNEGDLGRIWHSLQDLVKYLEFFYIFKPWCKNVLLKEMETIMFAFAMQFKVCF